MWKSRRFLARFPRSSWKEWEACFWLSTLSTAPSFPQLPLHRRYRGRLSQSAPIRRSQTACQPGNSVVALPTDSAIEPQIHDAVLTAFQLSAARYRLNQLRYDLRKMKAHGLIERDGKRYAYQLTGKGTKVALTFVLFHQRLCGPLANSLFHHQPNYHARPNSKLQAAYHKADQSIRNVIQLLEAA